MNNLRKKVEICLLSIALFLGIGTFLCPFLETASFVIDWLVFPFLIYEIPSLLDRFYRTSIFNKKVPLRLIIAISFAALYSMFAFYFPEILTFPMQPVFPSEHPIAVPSFIFSGLCLFLVLAFLAALEIRKYPDIALTLFQRMHSGDQLEQDIFEMEETRFGHFRGAFFVGLVIEGITLFLVMFRLLSLALAPLFLLIVVIWLVHDVLLLTGRSKHRRLVDTLLKSDEQIEMSFAWRSLFRPVLSGPSGLSISLLIAFCYGIFSLFVIRPLPYPLLMLIFWATSCCWYPFLLLNLLVTRLNREIRFLRDIRQKTHATLLPPFKDLVMLLVLINIVSRSAYGFLPNYQSVYSWFLLLALSIGANVTAFFSVALYLKKKAYRLEEIVDRKSFFYDRYRVILIVILVSILLFIPNETPIFFVLTLMVILYHIFTTDLSRLVASWRPLSHSLIQGMAFFTMLVLITLLLSLFEIDGVRPFEGLISPLLVASGIISMLAVVVFYHSQTLRHHRRKKLCLWQWS